MSKHTEGPWVYAVYEVGVKVTTVAHCCEFVIGLPSDIPGGNYRDGDPAGDPEADARLIAAAPELLEALMAVAGYSDAPHVAPKKSLTYIQQTARAAIAKATGEQA